MAYAPRRDPVAELLMGTIDGTYKEVDQGRGGQVEDTTARTRADLSDVWYGIHEAAEKVTPFGDLVHTPTYRPTRPVTYPWG